MRSGDVQLLIRYLYWIRDRVLDAAARAPIDVLTAPASTVRDLRATLVHELDVEWSWRVRLQGATPDAWGPERELEPGDYDTLEAVREHWRRDEAEMLSWVSGLSDEELAAPVGHRDDALPLSFYLLHVVIHGIQQFADAATLLTAAGQSPGDIEFLEFADTLRDPGP